MTPAPIIAHCGYIRDTHDAHSYNRSCMGNIVGPAGAVRVKAIFGVLLIVPQ